MPDPARVAAATTAEPEPSPLQKLLTEKSLPAAISRLRPSWKDTVNELDPGAAHLGIWSAGNLTWSALQAIPETKHALVLKDPESERGRRNCYTGTIGQITVDRSAGPTLYSGSVVTAAANVARFIAVRSTGQLVENSPATFCGIVTGTQAFSNAGGGTTHAVFLVGMFDLPENRIVK